MAVSTTNQVSPTMTLLFFLFLFLLGVAHSSSIYEPIDNIPLDCGSHANSPNYYENGRIWVGDIDSKYFPPDHQQNGVSMTSKADAQPTSVTTVPYMTARLSRSQFTYSFPVTPGQKFIRLYFYSANYQQFDRSKALFSVKAGPFTLLRDFNTSVNADASHNNEFFREFCVHVEESYQKLNLTFTPTNQDSYAFISGIEIVSMPSNLYYTPLDLNDEGGRGLKQVGQNNKFFAIENYTSLEMVYRINIAGKFLSPIEDTGMYRTWYNDEVTNFLKPFTGKYDAQPANSSINLNYSSKVPEYTAPVDVYRTARTMGPDNTENKRYNLTWEFPIDPGFLYMIRLHFCEFQEEINSTEDRVFLIYIRDTIVEQSADVFRWAGGKGIPYRRDYVVLVSKNDKKKMNLSVNLQANPDDSKTRYANVILNGIEIFKLNDTDGNLGGKNPDPLPTTQTQSFPPPKNHSERSKMAAIIIPIVVGCVVAMILAMGLFVIRQRKTLMDQSSSDGTSWWALYSISTNKSSKSRNSNLPSDLCRYFSLAEIKAATKNFDDNFIIGVGGFGNVYKGYVDDGATQVAIKRLKPGSKQGAHEFKTEIEMLSQLRHLHLVSLIGYCNDGNEMILVYDYMSHGTLRNHLYGDDEQPLTWKQRLQICIGAAKGLHYLHMGAKHTIIHRDVKTTNILLDEKWVAKVSDFGLSKVGPTDMSKAHISTVVKGSFGYLDPEYYRRQQLTEKSDVYSFGVVLCEVLCARPPLMRLTDKKQVYLAEWVRRCNRDNTIAQIIDPNIKNEISPECLRKFIEIAVRCIQDDGINRPSMNDVVWGLEFAVQLQEASKKKEVQGDKENSGGDNYSEKREGREEEWLMEETSFSSSNDRNYGLESSMSSDMTTSNSDNSSYVYNKGMSGTVFSEIKVPTGR